MLIASLVVPFKIVVDGTTFLIGFLFFSQPILSRVAYKLTHRFPNWRKYLELRQYVCDLYFLFASLTKCYY